jgi:hypothetical protein
LVTDIGSGEIGTVNRPVLTPSTAADVAVQVPATSAPTSLLTFECRLPGQARKTAAGVSFRLYETPDRIYEGTASLVYAPGSLSGDSCSDLRPGSG